MGLSKKDRPTRLNERAIIQMEPLLMNASVDKILK